MSNILHKIYRQIIRGNEFLHVNKRSNFFLFDTNSIHTGGNNLTIIPPPPYAVFSTDGINTLNLINSLDYKEAFGPSSESALFGLYWMNLNPIAGNITITPSNANIEIWNPQSSIWYSVAFNVSYLAATSSLAGFKVRLKAGLTQASYSTMFTITTANTSPFVLTCSGAVSAADYIIATGGTITTDGNYKVHTLNSSDNFVVTQLATNPTYNDVSYLLVAGGGSGGLALVGGNPEGGGGGAGGLLTGTQTVVINSYSGIIGAGGTSGSNGSDSTIFGLTAIGGGAGGRYFTPVNGGNGGSGGGSTYGGTAGTGTGGQGNNGGTGTIVADAPWPSGGGGGAGAVGQNSTGTTISGNGGIGVSSSISGVATYYAGGGGGGGGLTVSFITPGIGGLGGGGNGGNEADGISGTSNTGGGGGGAGSKGIPPTGLGGDGGSGVIIIRYKFQ